MEAINQNPVFYEFMAQMAYHRNVPDVYSWVSNYAIRRYGLEAPEVSSESKNSLLIAWKQLYENNYNGENPFCSLVCWDRASLITGEPTWAALQERTTLAGPLVDIWTLFLSAKLPNSWENHAFTYDLVDIGRQVMSNLFNDYFHFTKAFYNRSDVRNYQIFMNELLQLISQWDQLLSTHESYLVGKWVSEAVRWAIDDQERELFAYNAKNQITLWGPNGEISDYASKNWAGLVKEYYLPRWKLFLTMSFEALLKHQQIDQDNFEEYELDLGRSFCNTSIPFGTEAIGCPIKLSEEFLLLYGNGYQSIHHYERLENQSFEGLIINYEEQPTWTSNINQLKRLCDLIQECVGFTSQGLLKSSFASLVPNQNGITSYLKKRSTL
jgi:alpha-N-acetylglucosaminidase